jgi:serine/threonine protein phosphatase PrpC
VNTPAAGLRFDVAGFSERGPRSENQDAFAIDAFADRSLISLADGMGGEKSGRVAADTALATLDRLAPIRTVEQARRAVREANEEISRASASDPGSHGGMGCALGFLSLIAGPDGAGWIAAHVGDVRIFSRSPDGVLRLETRDHTPAFARWEAGEISLDEIPESVGANRLQRAVGRGGEADVVWLPAAAGWSWLIVSDGVYKAMRVDELGAALAAPTAGAACEEIRRKVTERGADDNFTAVVARAEGNAPAAPSDRVSSPTPVSEPRAQTPANKPMNATGRRSSSALALGLAALALLLSGAALAMLLTGTGSRTAAEIPRLRAEVDSLRAVVAELTRPIDPFGPSLPSPATSDSVAQDSSSPTAP